MDGCSLLRMRLLCWWFLYWASCVRWESIDRVELSNRQGKRRRTRGQHFLSLPLSPYSLPRFHQREPISKQNETQASHCQKSETFCVYDYLCQRSYPESQDYAQIHVNYVKSESQTNSVKQSWSYYGGPEGDLLLDSMGHCPTPKGHLMVACWVRS